ncbi:MAG: BON domain-containing protein [Dehalococcoidia bacterium]|jgi:osmotically-inducible protein OsmY
MTGRKVATPSEKDIEGALAGALEIDHLRASILNGLLYIDGNVGSLRDKRRATEIATSLVGAAAVINRLRVAPQVARSDNAIAKAARERLRALSEPAGISATCRHGVLSLEGEVGSWAARQSADKAARLVNGVVNVVNHVKVKGREHPRELEGEIRRALHEFLSLDTRLIEVKFDRGTVRLKGSVPSPYHRLAAEDLVRWFAPVHDVINGLVTTGPLPLTRSRDTIHKREISIPSA